MGILRSRIWEGEEAGQWVRVGGTMTSGVLAQEDRGTALGQTCRGPLAPVHTRHHIWALATSTAASSLPSATGTQLDIIFLFLLARCHARHLRKVSCASPGYLFLQRTPRSLKLVLTSHVQQLLETRCNIN